MTKRNLLLFSFPLLLALTLVAAWLILYHQGERFEAIYLNELKQETKNRLDQITLFFVPLLANNDLETLDRYCDTLTNQQQSVAIFDLRGAAIVASENAKLRGILDDPDIQEALRTGNEPMISIRRNPQTNEWTAYATTVIQVRSKSLLIRLVIPDPDADAVLKRLESSLLIFFLAPFALAYLIWYLVRRVARPLDQLQYSAERIAAGDLNVPVAVPLKGAVRELALSMAAMTERLKKEVETVRRQENFRRDFIANISHEIKTPLTGILSAIQMLDEGGWNNPDYLAKCHNVLTRQTQTLQILVRDVLQLAELDRMGETETDFTPVLLCELISEQVRRCVETFNMMESVFHWTPDNPVLVWGNARLLEQAIFNLLSNAVKYGNGTTIELSLTIQNNQNNSTTGNKIRSDNILLTVRDHGPGIPEEYKEQIFERFFRMRREYGRRPEGTGLGLAIVRQIAALHHGSVQLITPNDGPGACFVLTLPLAKEE